MSTYMESGDERRGAAHDKFTHRWRELGDDGNQEPDDTLMDGVHR